ncbi:MAG TPA: ATP-binding protein, partial [Candidatus Tectomicrobia bacterium]|nr:ATP-binding protein [Candidatus Tectomicrobia bacterium]
EDEGRGLADADLARVFEPYYRAPDAAATARGTGLGLAVVRALVEAHGGRVRADNRPTGGARFTLALPVTGRVRTHCALP